MGGREREGEREGGREGGREDCERAECSLSSLPEESICQSVCSSYCCGIVCSYAKHILFAFHVVI